MLGPVLKHPVANGGGLPLAVAVAVESKYKNVLKCLEDHS